MDNQAGGAARGRRRFRRELPLAGLALVLGGLLGLIATSPGMAGARLEAEHFPISAAPGGQLDPRVSGRYVVWLDYRHRRVYGDPADVYARDLDEDRELWIGSGAIAYRPDVSGHRAVYTVDGPHGFDILGYDFEQGQPFTVVDADGHQLAPAIDGNLVVWEDVRTGNSDIRGRDLARGRDLVVSDDLGDQQNPAISHGVVVWEDALTVSRLDPFFYFHRSNIAYKDLRTGRGGRITDDGHSERPAISGQWIAYVNGSMDNAAIKLYSLWTGETRTAAEGLVLADGPAISGSLVVWSAFRDDRRDDGIGSEVWVYDLDADEAVRLAPTKGGDLSPDISGQTVVWAARLPGGGQNIVGARLRRE